MAEWRLVDGIIPGGATRPVCEMGDGGVTVRFATGEFSNTAWGFYLPPV